MSTPEVSNTPPLPSLDFEAVLANLPEMDAAEDWERAMAGVMAGIEAVPDEDLLAWALLEEEGDAVMLLLEESALLEEGDVEWEWWQGLVL